MTFSERIDLTSDVGATVPVLDGSGNDDDDSDDDKDDGVDDEMDDGRGGRRLRVGRRRR